MKLLVLIAPRGGSKRIRGTNISVLGCQGPLDRFHVNVGIYMYNPQKPKLIPNNTFYEMPSLFEKLIGQGRITSSFTIREYWLDIGRTNECEKANNEYSKVFH